ncbi:hypothetical protein SDJN03_26878, partial [Cucurbita argyrosperma subsp. sororia]
MEGFGNGEMEKWSKTLKLNEREDGEEKAEVNLETDTKSAEEKNYTESGFAPEEDELAILSLGSEFTYLGFILGF